MSAGYVAPTLQQLLSLEVGSARRAHRTYQQLKRAAWVGPTHAYCAEQAKSLRDHALRRARVLLAVSRPAYAAPAPGTPTARIAVAAKFKLTLTGNALMEELAAERVRAELNGAISGPTQYPNYGGRLA